MPCIVDKNHKTSKSKDNIFVSLCGKTLYASNEPFRSIEEAKKGNKPICLKCRSIAGLPAVRKRKTITEPYTLYCVLMGGIQEITVIAETDVNYMKEGGGIHAKRRRVEDIYWRRAGQEAGGELFTKDKEEAIEFARTQLNQRREYLQSLIEEANVAESILQR